MKKGIFMIHCTFRAPGDHTKRKTNKHANSNKGFLKVKKLFCHRNRLARFVVRIIVSISEK